MIAHCGINCYECASYLGTIKGDIAQLEKMNKDFGDDKSDAIDFVCLGCKYSDLNLIASDCARCAIRVCAIKKGIDICATCIEYETCETVKPYRGDGTSARDKMNDFLKLKNLRARS